MPPPDRAAAPNPDRATRAQRRSHRAGPELSRRLLRAIDEDDLPMVERLLAQGADPSALHHTVAGGTPAMMAATFGRPAILSALIEAGADLDASDSRGFTACHFAVAGSHVECLLLLTSAGARFDTTPPDPYQYGGVKWNPVQWAAIHGELRCLAILAAAGANLSRPDRDGLDPLALARRAGHDDCASLIEAELARAQLDESIPPTPASQPRRRGI